MKRREMLRTSAMVASETLFGKNILAQPNSPILPSDEEVPSDLVKRFGDARDWFFEKRFGMFIR